MQWRKAGETSGAWSRRGGEGDALPLRLRSICDATSSDVLDDSLRRTNDAADEMARRSEGGFAAAEWVAKRSGGGPDSRINRGL